MKFKVGDKVINVNKGDAPYGMVGVIVYIDMYESYLVDYGQDYTNGHDGSLSPYTHPTSTCWWEGDDTIEAIE